MRRQREASEDLAQHLAWLAVIVRDRKVPTRQILEGILDALDALTDMVDAAAGPPGRDR